MAALPANYGLIAGIIGASALVHHVYMPLMVSKARKQYKIEYPDLYATSDNCKNEEHRKKFNCVQRAHQNSLENQPINLAMILVAGTQYPIAASILGAIFLFGKVLYFKGYASGEPSKRTMGAPSYIGTIGLLGICVTVGVRAMMALISKA